MPLNPPESLGMTENRASLSINSDAEADTSTAAPNATSNSMSSVAARPLTPNTGVDCAVRNVIGVNAKFGTPKRSRLHMMPEYW